MGELIGQTAGRMSVAGTFSGMALAGLGAGIAAEETARHSRRTGENTRNSGLTFSQGLGMPIAVPALGLCSLRPLVECPTMTSSYADRPNVLLIYTDQQRYDTIAALGHGRYRTPNLDRLVERGVSFTQATTPCPVCVAARWSLHSGQYVSAHHSWSNHHWANPPALHLPGLLRQAGYRTGLIGKNHCFLRPEDFDVFQENPLPVKAPGWPARQRWQARQSPRLSEEPAPGGVEADPEHAKTEAALEFIRSSGRPFFCWLSYLYPHTPYHVPEPWFGLYRDADLGEPAIEPEGLAAAGKPFRQQFHQRNNDRILPYDADRVRTMRRVYAGMVSMVDAEVGRVLDVLDATGLAERTWVIFTSDHGDYMGDHGLITKSPALYDCLIRVPLIISGPGVVGAGRRDERPASAVDLMPTVLEWAGLDVPDPCQGLSLAPYAADGGAGPVRRDATFSEYGVPGQPYTPERLREEGLADTLQPSPYAPGLPWEGNPVSLAGRIYAVRTPHWKYVHEPDGTDELYDLQVDPHELVNLAGQRAHAATQADLRRRLEAWRAEVARPS